LPWRLSPSRPGSGNLPLPLWGMLPVFFLKAAFFLDALRRVLLTLAVFRSAATAPLSPAGIVPFPYKIETLRASTLSPFRRRQCPPPLFCWVSKPPRKRQAKVLSTIESPPPPLASGIFFFSFPPASFFLRNLRPGLTSPRTFRFGAA